MTSVLSENNFMERLLELSKFKELIAEVEEYILSRRVRAYHCTKELEPDFFRDRGLRPLSMQEHINEFLENVVSHRKPELLGRFRSVYDRWLQSSQRPRREGKIAFCMSPYLVKDSGNSSFFEYYGGEALYWPLIFPNQRVDQVDDECLDFLGELGRPVVVEVAVPASDFTTFKEYAFAQDILSHYAKRHNSEFVADSLEAFLERSAQPSEIVTVHNKDAFWSKYWPGLENTDEY
jgi:hypothetical protein